MEAVSSTDSKPKFDYEFGGPLGTLLIMLFTHLLVYYLWISLTYYQGGLVLPAGFADIGPFFRRMGEYIAAGAFPTPYAATIYTSFMLLQFVLASCMPGLWMKGLPVLSENGKQYNYLCNALSSWYLTLIIMLLLHFTGLLPLTVWADQLGPLITVSIIFSNLISLALLIVSWLLKKQANVSGNPIYDFFMGAMLNPRVGIVDVKLFTDIRPWMLLFLVTVSASAKQYQLYGEVTWPMIFMLLAHGLYTNACMKGEECVPTTWDIFQEKCGWMIVFWNFTVIPFAYSFQSFYILKNNLQFPFIYMLPLFILLLGAYYVWDTANSQKNRFRMQRRGTYTSRHTFPQLPWGTLVNPRYFQTAKGNLLLTDGWYRYARKIHYAADFVMALTWGLSCGFGGILPYFYPACFFGILLHRYRRDDSRCRKKYGSEWEHYCQIVPYKFIPYIY